MSAASADADLMGKSASDLQENIEIGEDGISGTLKYVTGYTGFSEDVSEQTGNYLALYITESNGAAITVELTEAVALGDDGLIVLRITDKETQTVTVMATLQGCDTVTQEYALTDLTLTPAPDNP